MPKEIVYSDLLPHGEKDPARAIVEVGWTREHDVQIATRCIRADDEEVYDFDPGKPIPVERGYYVDLGRRQINDLIRNLRRARDQAFGRDE